MISNLLIIDSQINDINIIINSINLNTKYVILDYYNDDINSLTYKINQLNTDIFTSIGFIKEEYYDIYYKLFDNQEYKPILINVKYEDKNLKSWINITNFLSYLKNTFKFNDFDFISCNLAQYYDYKYIFNYYFNLLNININASSCLVGNCECGGSWILKNKLNIEKNIKNTYFTDNLLNYTHLLSTSTLITLNITNNTLYYSENLIIHLNLSGNNVTTTNNGLFTLIDNLNTVYLSVASNNIPLTLTIFTPSVLINNFIATFTPINNSLFMSCTNNITVNILKKQITPIFNINKIYDKTQNVNLTYTLSGIFYNDISNVDLSNNYYALYRSYDANIDVFVDIFNISLFGYKSINYSIINNLTTTGNIYKKQLIVYGNNKQYNNSYTATINLFGQIESDYVFIINYYASFNNISIGRQTINYYSLTISGLLNNYILPLYNGITYSLILPNIISKYNIKAINNSNYDQIIWSLEGYSGTCCTTFNLNKQIYVGLSEQNNYLVNNYFGYFIYVDVNNNVYVAEMYNNDITFSPILGTNNNNSNFLIYFDGSNVNYYQDNILIKYTPRTIRKNLYLNILFGYVGQTVTNIFFVPIKEFYYGGNNIICNGFKSNDSIYDLSGTIIYSGTSQGAHDGGRYTIVPSGFTSNNYNIVYINGHLNIRISLQS